MLIFLSAFLYARGTTVDIGETVPADGGTTATTDGSDQEATPPPEDGSGSDGPIPQVTITPADGGDAASGEGSDWENSGILGVGETSGDGGADSTAPEENAGTTGTQLSSCGEFPDAEACPSLWQPVCAKIEKGISAPYEIEWKTFANSCTACASSTRMEVVAGYYEGECPPAPQNGTGGQPQPDGNGEDRTGNSCAPALVLAGMALASFVRTK
jgi:hypothetical protein